ncbi:MAG TPA: ABC transporter ATP-binding protein [Symbiobacteriaceae bacterium]|jgi:ATP-binding cassette subfamily B protein
MSIPLTQYWRLLRKYLRPLWPKVLLLGILLLGSIGLQLYSPTVLRRFIDEAPAGAPGFRLTVLAALFLGLAVANQLLVVWATYVSQDVGWRTTNELRAELTEHVLGLDLSFHKDRTPGEMIERIDGDVTALTNFFSAFVVQVATNALLLAGVLVVLYTVDWRAGLALTGFAALNLAALLRTRHIAMPGWQATRQASAEYFGYLSERLAGLEDIRANGAENAVRRGFVQALRGRVEAELKAGRGMAVMLVVSFGLLAVGMATAFGIGLSLVTAGAISVGTAYMIFFYTEQLRRPTEQIVQQLQDLARAGAGIDRIRELLALRSTVADGAGTPLPDGPLAVAADGLTFGYVPGTAVLDNVSFTLKPGEVLGLRGRTGSGKSTIARLVARLYDPAEGSIRLGGVDVRTVRLADLRRRVGVVTQEVQIFRGTLRDNLTLFDAAIPDSRIWAALDELGLREWAESLPIGLDTELATGGGLSAGEAQVLAFARVFLKDPGVVILDEASSRLDPATEQRLERAIDRLLQGRTAIVITHRLATLRRADLVLSLADGSSSLQSDPEEALG